jgi:hypothetical protein
MFGLRLAVRGVNPAPERELFSQRAPLFGSYTPHAPNLDGTAKIHYAAAAAQININGPNPQPTIPNYYQINTWAAQKQGESRFCQKKF